MASMHAEAAETITKKVMATPLGKEVVLDYWDGLTNERWSQDYVDMVFQLGGRWGKIGLVEAYCFSQVHTLIMIGAILVTRIAVQREPVADKNIVLNNVVLETLPHPFIGAFWGGLADEDGWLQWKEPIRATNCSTDENTYTKPWRIPLEVGYTQASRTMLHIAQDRGLARWPYGQKQIWVLRLVDDDIFRVRLSHDRRARIPQMELFGESGAR